MQLSLLNNPKDAELLADAEFMTASLYAVLDNHADEIVVNALKILANAQDSSKIITELLPSLSDEQTENLITAVGIFAQILNIAEDVHHERRRLVLLTRETPLNLAHLRNMTAVTEMGGIICPPVPAFYQRPADLATMIDHMVGRVLDLFNIEQGLNPPWDPPARRGQPRQDEENP